MSRLSLKRISRPARIGVLVGVAVPLIIAPFLAYAGLAIADESAKWADSNVARSSGAVVGVGAFFLWFLIVFGLPGLCGGLLGEAVHRARIRQRDA